MHSLTKSGAVALLLGAAGAACAQSSATISGVIDTGISYAHKVGDGTQSKVSAANSILGVSNVGFRGREDLGGGNSAIFNMQAGFNPSNGAQSASGQLFSRNAFVGLETPAGTVTVGKQWNFNDDWLVGSVFKGGYNAGAVFKFSEFDAVSEIYNNTLKYVSPVAAGFQGGAMFGFGEAAGGGGAGRVYNVALKYQRGALMLAATYDHENAGGAVASGSVYKLTALGGRYGFGALTARLGGAYSDISGAGAFQSIPSLGARKAYAVEAGLDYAATPALTLSADLLYRRNTTLDNHSRVYRLLGLYGLSRRTSLVANLAHIGNGGGAAETLLNTDSGAVGGGFANHSQSALALGVRHQF